MRTIIEIRTPLQPDAEKYVADLSRLDNFAAVILEEEGGLSSIAVAEMLKKCCDKEIFLKISCRDRNRIALHSELLTAASAGLTNVVLVDGLHPVNTPFAAAKPVYELDSLSLLRMIKHNSPDFGHEITTPLASMPWMIGVSIGGSTSADVARAKKFLAAGADLFFARALDAVPRLRHLTDKPIILCVPEEEAADISEIRREAESAGASGINLIVKTPENVLDGTIVARQR